MANTAVSNLISVPLANGNDSLHDEAGVCDCNIIVYMASFSCSPLAALQMALPRDSLLDHDREWLWDACSRPPWTVSREDWYAGHFFSNSSIVAPSSRNWRLQEEAASGHDQIGSITGAEAIIGSSAVTYNP
jgi:hypothetical protein